MANQSAGRFIRRMAETAGYAQTPDSELLARFASDRDETAFKVLIDRYTRLVWSVAARVLSDPSDIEDATQATFLVLVQRAGRAGDRSGLGPWLGGVAHRVSVRLRTRSRRRPGPLGDVEPADPLPAPDLSWREACDLLHAELDRLPDCYRLPLLLCYVEGYTRDEAATALGVSSGAVKGRVRRGCVLLGRRLSRWGVSLPVGLLAISTATQSARASSCPALWTPVSEPASPRVNELAQEVTRFMASKTKKLTAFGLVTVALVVGAGLVAGFSPAPAHRPVSAAPVPRAAPPAAFLVQHNGNLMYIAANGKEEEKIDPPAWNGSLSPNGQRLAALEFAADIGRAKLVIRSRREQDESATVPLVFGQPGRSGGHMVWSADGRRTLIVETGFGDKGKREYAHRVYDLITKQLTDVKLPDGCLATGWSADGKRFLGDVRPSDDTVRVAWLSAEGAGKPEYISPDDEIAYGGRLSPNGKRVLYMSGPKPAKDQQAKIRLHVQDLATGKRTPVDEPGETHGYCWSPDGSRVAYTWQRSLEKPSEVPERETQLITADPDGRNRKVVTSRKYEVPENSSGRASVVLFFSVWDWR